MVLVSKGVKVHPASERAWAELVGRVLPASALPIALALALLYGLGRGLARRASWGVASALLLLGAATLGGVVAIPMQELYVDALGGAAQIPPRWSVGVSVTGCAFLLALSGYGAHRTQREDPDPPLEGPAPSEAP